MCTGFSSLQHLILDGCYSLNTLAFLPTTLRTLSLDMQRRFFLISEIESVEDVSLPNLENLTITRCAKLKRLALHATLLQVLDLSGCVGLEELDCRGLSSLQHLILDTCYSLATLSFLPMTLRRLSLNMKREIGLDRGLFSDMVNSLESVDEAPLPNLEDLSIKCCPELKRLALDATSLQKLDLRGCERLMDLDCRGLSSLQHLVIDDCFSLTTLSILPTTLRKISLRISRRSLREGGLESVEDASLPNLEDLTITRCPKLKRLALDSTSLQSLDLNACGGLNDLACKGLSSLQHLILDGCSSLTRLSFLPTTLSTLSWRLCSVVSVEDFFLPNLQELTLQDSPMLKRLALHATSLQRLDLSGSGRLEDLHCRGLSSLQHLILDRCYSLTTLSFLPTTLRRLSLNMQREIGLDRGPFSDMVGSLESVDDAPLRNLEHVTITCCPELKSLALNATSLQRLDLSECGRLKDLDCRGLSSLQHLILDGCYSLTTLSFLPTTLRRLSLNMQREIGLDRGLLSDMLGSLESVDDAPIPNLEDLTITCCPELKSLALNATSLQRLDLSECGRLKDLDCRGLSSLQHLILDGCYSLTTLSFLPTTLQRLSLNMQREIGLDRGLLSDMLGSLESVDDAPLPNLEDLTITCCPELKSLALNATSLQRLDLSECGRLKDLDCRFFPSLDELILSNCTSLKTLSFLPSTLTRLDIEECTELEFLDVGDCTDLLQYCTYVGGCTSLRPSNIRRPTSWTHWKFRSWRRWRRSRAILQQHEDEKSEDEIADEAECESFEDEIADEDESSDPTIADEDDDKTSDYESAVDNEYESSEQK
ncbi:hypothetical protein KP509_22G048900 [Ceratopteris richardii]|uniref:Uncharacterized protein n=1 Tax=Ceratopteris richardii TaxID=49495 RepID=A0A8T2S804_CERRI|nr:hypothetical protein KP509_22G048900 [Ceratopteris richardii]KAH7307180.1 hypothetical protein KP509_22G048900 [Ceratopteris richardii]